MRQDRVTPRRSLVARARRLVRRRWMFLVAFPLVGLIAAYGLSASHQDRYESSAKLLLHEQAAPGVSADVAEGASAADASRETATNVDLVSSDEVALRVYTALRPPITLDAFLDSVDIASKGDSELVTITVRDADPVLAARIANTWADQYRAFRREADDARAAAATSIVDQRLAALPPHRLAGAEGQALRRQRDELAVAASLQRGSVEVAQRAREATSPVSPRPLRAALIGGLAGLAIALVLALLAQRLDRRVPDADAAAALHGLPLLGQIPKASALATPPPSVGGDPVLPPLAPAETDAFRVLRTSIAYPDVERRISSVLVTSAVSGEGKTTVALNLARAYAESGARTLLIEGDLRRPVLSERLSLAAEPGLAAVLRSEATLESATRRTALDAGNGRRARRVPRRRRGRRRGAHPQTLLEGKRMSRILEGLEDRYEMVVVDGAPGLGVSDAAPLMREVGAVLVVSRVGRTQIHESQALRERLELLGIRPLGVVANGVSRRARHYSQREVAPVPG